MSTTLAQYRTQVAAKLGLDNSGSNPGSLTADQTLMHLWANQAYEEILAESKCYVLAGTLSLNAGDTDVTIPSTWLALTEVFAPNSSNTTLYRRMQRKTAAELLQYRLGVAAANSQPLYYAVQGANMFMVYPTPGTAATLTVYYVPQPSTLSADADTASFIPPEWQKLIEYYMLWQGGVYVKDASSHMGADHLVVFQAELTKFKAAVRNYGGRVLAPTPVGRPRRPIFRRDQDDGL